MSEKSPAPKTENSILDDVMAEERQNYEKQQQRDRLHSFLGEYGELDENGDNLQAYEDFQNYLNRDGEAGSTFDDEAVQKEQAEKVDRLISNNEQFSKLADLAREIASMEDGNMRRMKERLLFNKMQAINEDPSSVVNQTKTLRGGINSQGKVSERTVVERDNELAQNVPAVLDRIAALTAEAVSTKQATKEEESSTKAPKSREDRTREAAAAALAEAGEPEGAERSSEPTAEDRTAEAAAAAMGDADKESRLTGTLVEAAKAKEADKKTPDITKDTATEPAADKAKAAAENPGFAPMSEAPVDMPKKPELPKDTRESLDTSASVEDGEFGNLPPEEEYNLLHSVVAKNEKRLRRLNKREKRYSGLESADESERYELLDNIAEGKARLAQLEAILNGTGLDKDEKSKKVEAAAKEAKAAAAATEKPAEEKAPEGTPGKDRPATEAEVEAYRMRHEAVEDDALKRFKLTWRDRVFFPTPEKKQMAKATKAIKERRKTARKTDLLDHLQMAGLDDTFMNRLKTKRAARKAERHIRKQDNGSADTVAKRLRNKKERTARILEQLKK